jgi:hypothetical protein
LQTVIPPFSVSGSKALKKQIIHLYGSQTASFRGVNAVRLLSKGEKYTLDKIIADGYNTKLSILKC